MRTVAGDMRHVHHAADGRPSSRPDDSVSGSRWRRPAADWPAWPAAAGRAGPARQTARASVRQPARRPVQSPAARPGHARRVSVHRPRSWRQPTSTPVTLRLQVGSRELAAARTPRGHRAVFTRPRPDRGTPPSTRCGRPASRSRRRRGRPHQQRLQRCWWPGGRSGPRRNRRGGTIYGCNIGVALLDESTALLRRAEGKKKKNHNKITPPDAQLKSTDSTT